MSHKTVLDALEDGVSTKIFIITLMPDKTYLFSIMAGDLNDKETSKFFTVEMLIEHIKDHLK